MAITKPGSTSLDNEADQLMQKPFAGGLGMVWLENHASWAFIAEPNALWAKASAGVSW